MQRSLYKSHKPNYPSNQQIKAYDDIENYGIIGDAFGKAVGLTEGTVKTLAKATADNLVTPIATKIVIPISTHVARAEFLKIIATKVYIDESGIDNTEDYEYGYCKKERDFTP